MAELKTKKNVMSIAEMRQSLSSADSQADFTALLSIFSEVTGEKPLVWSNGVVGFGTYSYASTRSSQKGEWFVTGFAFRKNTIAIYIIPGLEKYQSTLKTIGKHKVSGKSCLHIKKLSDIDITVLKQLIKQSVQDMKGMNHG